MKRRLLPWIAAAALTLLGLTLVQRHSLTVEARTQRKVVWKEYLRGPLSDLLFASSRMRPLLAKKHLSKAEMQQAQEAGEAYRSSRLVMPRIRTELKGDPTMAPMDRVLTWHQEIGGLMEPWRGIQKRGMGKDALTVEAQMRLDLWRTLDGLRTQLLADKTLSDDEILEMNAMLYSLKEDTVPNAGQAH